MTIATYKSRVLPIFAVFIALAGIFAYLSQFLSPDTQRIAQLFWVFLLIISLFTRAYKKIGAIIATLMVIFSGVVLGPGIDYIVNNGGEGIIAVSFISTCLLFILLSFIAIRSNDQYLSWGRYLSIGLIISILASIINIFILSSLFEAIISSIILIIFLGFVLFDTENILRNYEENDYIYAALNLFYDFINIFIRIIDFLNSIRK